MKKIFLENILKNIVLIAALVFVYPILRDFLQSSEVFTNKALAGDLLVAVSILSVTACFGAFSFTYEKIQYQKYLSRLIAHICTGLLMAIIGIALEISAILAEFLVGQFHVLSLSWLLLYIAIIFYDFWDLQRILVTRDL